MLILPAIDIIGGRCVRLTQGDYSRQTVYADDPAEVARSFSDAGASWIHIVDLDGAKAGAPVNLATIERIVSSVPCSIEVGGGVRDFASVDALLSAGVARVIVGTKIVKEPSWASDLFAKYGARVVAGIDARDGMAAVSGWTEGSSVSALELAKRVEAQGCKRLILTDIATDGAFTGPNLAFLREVAGGVSIPVIASGGVSCLADVQTLAAMKEPSVEGVIVGKALYEGRIDLGEALSAMARHHKDRD